MQKGEQVMEGPLDQILEATKSVREKGGSFTLKIESRQNTQEVVLKLFTTELQVFQMPKHLALLTNYRANDEDVNQILIEMRHILNRQGFGVIRFEVDTTKGNHRARIVAENETRRRLPNK